MSNKIYIDLDNRKVEIIEEPKYRVSSNINSKNVSVKLATTAMSLMIAAPTSTIPLKISEVSETNIISGSIGQTNGGRFIMDERKISEKEFEQYEKRMEDKVDRLSKDIASLANSVDSFIKNDAITKSNIWATLKGKVWKTIGILGTLLIIIINLDKVMKIFQ